MTSSDASPRLGHRPGLDGLRGIAVLLVVASHAAPGAYVMAGPVGVAMFFALSGYLITRILLAERDDHGSVDLRRFYLRRAARLLPAVLVLVAVMLAVGLAKPIHAAAVLTYTANVPSTMDWPMGGLAHTWSLAVEEQFYLVYPMLLLVCVSRGRRLLPWLLLAAAVASLALRVGLWWVGAAGERIYFATDTNAGLVLLGAAAGAWASRSPRAERSRPGLAGALVAVAMLLPLLLSDTATSRTWLPVLGALVGVVVVLRGASPAWLSHPVLTYPGRRSYGLYLWHFPLLWVLMPNLDLSGWRSAVVLLVASLLLAELSWRFVERPCQRWVRTRETRPAGPVRRGQPVPTSADGLNGGPRDAQCVQPQARWRRASASASRRVRRRRGPRAHASAGWCRDRCRVLARAAACRAR